MTTKITPFGTDDNGNQILEFNISIPKGALTSIAPIATLAVTPRFAEVYNEGTTSSPYYRQITKLDVVHNLQYFDCQGKPKVVTNVTSAIVNTHSSSATPERFVPQTFKVVDVIIPKGQTVVTQDLINDFPTTTPQVGHCAYSVFVLQNTYVAPVPSVQ